MSPNFIELSKFSKNVYTKIDNHRNLRAFVYFYFAKWTGTQPEPTHNWTLFEKKEIVLKNGRPLFAVW